MNEKQAQQVGMHTDFFDRCEFAINNGFYLEAMFLEYAAIKGRLEAILGILGAPCNKTLDAGQRGNIKISHRIECLKKIRNNNPVFAKTKLDHNFFYKNVKLSAWINKRNCYIHGLYKGEREYNGRMAGAKELAETGYKLCRALYNETKRLNRLRKSKPELFVSSRSCANACFSSNH